MECLSNGRYIVILLCNMYTTCNPPRALLLLHCVLMLGIIILSSKYFLQTCHPLDHYLIRHSVSGDQSPITVNRTNVTLYGVQPGETYYVDVTSSLVQGFTETSSMLHIQGCLCQRGLKVCLLIQYNV